MNHAVLTDYTKMLHEMLALPGGITRASYRTAV